MVLEMVDSCEAWEVKQRIKLKFLRNDGEEFDTDSSFTSYETKDGLGLRFSVRNIQDQEVEEELRGHADLEATGGKGRASLHAARGAQLRAAGRHAVPDHPSRPDHPARPRRRQIRVLQRVRRRPSRRRLHGQCRDRQAAARRRRTPACAAMSACCATSRHGACALPSLPQATRAPPIRSTSWRSTCWPTGLPGRCCSTMATSQSMLAWFKSKPCRGRDAECPSAMPARPVPAGSPPRRRLPPAQDFAPHRAVYAVSALDRGKPGAGSSGTYAFELRAHLRWRLRRQPAAAARDRRRAGGGARASSSRR